MTEIYSDGMDVRDKGTHQLSERARKHLWLHFARMGAYGEHADIPVFVRGDGPYIYDASGKEYFDGISGLFCSMIGHGRTDIAAVAAEQMSTMAYAPLWTYAHEPAILLAEKLASMTPGDLNRVFFTSGGAEAVESAWKLARQYHRLRGEPDRYKVISRDVAYHGTTMGALTVTSVEAYREPFAPLVPGAVKIPNLNFYRAPQHGDDWHAFGQWSAQQVEDAILREGPHTVACVVIEPVQNAGGCFVPPPGYMAKVREICDRYGVLMVSDEIICAFGRIGEWFGGHKFDYVPDIMCIAKGLTSGYAPLGAIIVRDEIADEFMRDDRSFLHGFTFAGHPVSCAVALKNIEIFENEQVIENVQRNQDYFKSRLETLYDLPIVGDVRGAGYFWGVELVKNKHTKETWHGPDAERLLRGFISAEMFRRGIIFRSDDRGDPVLQFAPPLITTRPQIDMLVDTLREVLVEAVDHHL
jgi:adenosylmethionine-8-amino-7-oxononanoate aminotransferase